MTKKIVVLGATSGIAQSVCVIWAARGYELFLIARNNARLNTIASDLKIRFHVAVHTLAIEFDHDDEITNAIQEAKKTLGAIDYALIAYGTLPDQAACETDLSIAKQSFYINSTSVFTALMTFSDIMLEQKTGVIGAITSVAGNRGRQSNFIYGMAKGMVQICLSGLRAKLHKHGVAVLDIRPGFVDTQMTSHIKKKGMLWANPETVAKDIALGFDKKKYVIYTPFFWKWIMLVVNALPIRIFNLLKI